MKKGYDEKCEDLALAFLEESKRLDLAPDLAQEIQNKIEDFLADVEDGTIGGKPSCFCGICPSCKKAIGDLKGA